MLSQAKSGQNPQFTVAEIAAIVAQEAFEWLDGPIVRVAGPDVPGVPFSRPLEKFVMPDAAKIEAAIRNLAAY